MPENNAPSNPKVHPPELLEEATRIANLAGAVASADPVQVAVHEESADAGAEVYEHVPVEDAFSEPAEVVDPVDVPVPMKTKSAKKTAQKGTK